MKILDENGRELTTYDAEKGYLTKEEIVIEHHDAIEAKAGRSHIEVVREYEKGGKDVVTVWDEEPTEAKEAYDETEEIQRYHAYTEDELTERKKEKEETENRKKKLDSLYNADMSFSDVVDAVAGMLYGGAE